MTKAFNVIIVDGYASRDIKDEMGRFIESLAGNIVLCENIYAATAALNSQCSENPCAVIMPPDEMIKSGDDFAKLTDYRDDLFCCCYAKKNSCFAVSSNAIESRFRGRFFTDISELLVVIDKWVHSIATSPENKRDTKISQAEFSALLEE